MNGAYALVRVGVESERAQRACAALAADKKVFEAAVKRTLPYLGRRKTRVEALEPRATLLGAAISELSGALHVTSLHVGGARGALVIDAAAIAHGLSGMLGGVGPATAPPSSMLSPAQKALAVRMAHGLAESLDSVFGQLGVHIEAAVDEDATQAAGPLVACTVKIGDGAGMGTIVLLLPVAPFAEARGPGAVPADNPVAAAAMSAVEVELAAELGRVPVPLARLATLRVGDVLRLPLPVDSSVRVLSSGRVLFQGKPTTRGGQIAVTLERHGD